MEEYSVLQVAYCVPHQDSVLEPLLWYIFYDELLSLKVSLGAHLMAFADDIVVVNFSERKANRVDKQSNVGCRMPLNGVKWTADGPQKSEVLVLTF